MVRRKEQEYLLQEAWRQQLLRGEIDRRQLLSRALVAGLGYGRRQRRRQVRRTDSARAAAPDPDLLSMDQGPASEDPHVNAHFPGVDTRSRPSRASPSTLRREAKHGESTLDVYVGMTSFVEMIAMIEADVIEPWDSYIPKEVIDDMSVDPGASARSMASSTAGRSCST